MAPKASCCVKMILAPGSSAESLTEYTYIRYCEYRQALCMSTALEIENFIERRW